MGAGEHLSAGHQKARTDDRSFGCANTDEEGQVWWSSSNSVFKTIQ